MTVAGAALALFIGAALQSATGFGFALVSAPILFALLGPQEAVTAGVIVGFLLNSLTLATERRRPQVLGREAVLLVMWSIEDPHTIVRVFASIGTAATLYALYYLRSERSWDFVYGIAYAYFSFFSLFWVFPYALLTLRARSWMTR